MEYERCDDRPIGAILRMDWDDDVTLELWGDGDRVLTLSVDGRDAETDLYFRWSMDGVRKNDATMSDLRAGLRWLLGGSLDGCDDV